MKMDVMTGGLLIDSYDILTQLKAGPRCYLGVMSGSCSRIGSLFSPALFFLLKMFHETH